MININSFVNICIMLSEKQYYFPRQKYYYDVKKCKILSRVNSSGNKSENEIELELPDYESLFNEYLNNNSISVTEILNFAAHTGLNNVAYNSEKDKIQTAFRIYIDYHEINKDGKTERMLYNWQEHLRNSVMEAVLDWCGQNKIKYYKKNLFRDFLNRRHNFFDN